MKKRFLIFLLIIAPLCINAVHASEDNAKLQLLKKRNIMKLKVQSLLSRFPMLLMLKMTK